MTILTKQQILSIPLPTQVVPVPEWGGEVIVRGLSVRERIEYEDCLSDNDREWRVKLVAFSAVGEDGKRLFTLDEVEALAGQLWVPIRRISEVAEQLSLIGQAKVQQAAENLAPGQAGASPTA